jgi:hypothetical protein
MSRAQSISGPPSSPPRPGFPGPASSLLLYALLTVILTWPLSLHLKEALPAGGNDLWQNYWNFWWWETALEHGKSPYSTDLIYQPGTVSLAFHTHSEASILLTLPLLHAFGVAFAHNTALLLGFVLAGWGGYFLIRELIGDCKAALLGGAVLAFFPHHLEQSLEHLNLVSYEAMPFFLCFLLRLARRGGLGNVLLAALFFDLNALFSWQNGLILLPLGLCLFFHELSGRARPRREMLRDVALSGLLAIAALLPFAWPMLREIFAGETYYLKPQVEKGIDPLFLLVPSDRHPIWGAAFQGLYERFRGYASAGFTCYLGIVPLALAAMGAARREDAPGGENKLPWRLWTALFIGYLLFAMGDPLTVLGWKTGVRLPFALVKHVPLFRTLRVANRFLIPAMVAFSVLSAWGTHRLITGRGPGAERKGAFWLLLALVLADLLWFPYPVQPVPRPAWTAQIAAAPPGLLLDIPGGYRARGAEDMFFQTLHGRPTAGGYASCTPPFIEKRVEELPFLKLIFEGRPSVHVDIPAGLEQALEALPIGVVVIHLQRTRERLEELQKKEPGSRRYNPEKGMPASDLEQVRAALARLWGAPYYRDDEVEIFGKAR